MKINLTIDNYFRHPLRWGRCPAEKIRGQLRMFGFFFKKELYLTSLTDRWVLVIYFYKWYKAWSNYPLYD